eukprot:jgi/Tetstr1/446130/TSEL_033730.t1
MSLHASPPSGRSHQCRRLASCVPWLEQNRPEVLAELRKVRNLWTGRLAQSKSLVSFGVADDRYRTDVCKGNEDAATYSRPSLAFLLHAQDVHASPPKGGVNSAFAARCPRCKDLAGVTPCFRIFQSMHPHRGAMMPGPEWHILSYHVPGMSAFRLPEVENEDEARRRKHRISFAGAAGGAGRQRAAAWAARRQRAAANDSATLMAQLSEHLGK